MNADYPHNIKCEGSVRFRNRRECLKGEITELETGSENSYI